MSKSTTPFVLDQNVVLAATEPLAALQSSKLAFAESARGHKTCRHATIATAYAAFLAMRAAPNKWNDFLHECTNVESSHSAADLPKKNAVKALQIILDFQFGALQSEDRVYKMARALEYCDLKKNLGAESVMRWLEDRGIEKLYQKATQELPNKGKTVAEKRVARAILVESEAVSSPNKEDAQDSTPIAKVTRKANLSTEMVIKAPDRIRTMLLDSKVGKKFKIFVRHSAKKPDGWHQFEAYRAVRIKKPSRHQ